MNLAERIRWSRGLRVPGRLITGEELALGADALATELVERGLAGKRVAVLADRHATVITAIVGVLDAGAIVVPLDPHAPPERLAAQVSRVEPDAWIVEAGARHAIARGEVLELDGVWPTRPSRGHARQALDPDGPCSIYFTSGSTGAPRAILGRLAGIAHHIDWEIGYLPVLDTARGAILHATTYDAYLCDWLVPLLAGGIACAPAERGQVHDAARLCEWLAREEIDLLHCTPSLFRSLLAQPAAARLGALRHVLLAGEVVRNDDLARARDVLHASVRLVNLYGPTEATFVKTYHEISDVDLARPVPIGRPMPGVTVDVVDGEIAITSPYGALGYVGEPELTAQKWRGQTYFTGDRGAWNPDGTLAFLGRRDRQVKILGARVDLDEVEALLCRCPGVVDAAALPVEGDVALQAFVVLAPGTEVAEVRRAAVAHLTAAMRLARLTAVDALPRTTSGKLDRRALG